MSDRTYQVEVTREGNAWLANVRGLAGAHSYARTLPALVKAVREVVVLAADLPDEAIDMVRLDWTFHTGNSLLDEETSRVRALRAEAEHITAQASAQTAAAARRLVDSGMSVRDAAVLLGVSPQRISQVTGHGRARAS